jgi:hypothetical protein
VLESEAEEVFGHAEFPEKKEKKLQHEISLRVRKIGLVE